MCSLVSLLEMSTI